MAKIGSFSDGACSHLQWPRGKALLAPQLAEPTLELADSKFMLDGMMACSMPVNVELAFKSPLAEGIVQHIPTVI